MRWNRQFNLVSRSLGELDIMGLIHQSLDAAGSIPDLLVQISGDSGSRLFGPGDESVSANIERFDISRVIYLDIGSGAGIPGLVWHRWLREALQKKPASARPLLRTILIEPKRKRAWFLQRVVRQLELDGIEVWNRRWEDATAFEDSSQRDGSTYWIVSLKALKLTDRAVIAGWRRVSGLSQLGEGDRLLICRFRPPSEHLGPALIREIGLPPAAPISIVAGDPPANTSVLVPCGSRTDPVASLLGSWYSYLPDLE